MTVTSLITPGMKLALPAGAVAPSSGGSGGGSSTASGAGGSYTVKAGDSLGGIASRNHVTLAALLAANNMTATSLITPGMSLALPAGATTAQPQSTDQPAAGSRIDTVLQFALAQQGKPYQFAASGPDAYDCSGLTTRALRPDRRSASCNRARRRRRRARRSRSGASRSSPATSCSWRRAATTSSATSGIAIDGDTWIQARRPGDVVRVGPMPAKSSIVAVRRFVTSG